MNSAQRVKAKRAVRDGQREAVIHESAGQRAGGSGRVFVPCFPLHLVVERIHRKTVDYWSLDTEGSEAGILNATDFGRVEVGLITVEHNGIHAARSNIQAVLTRAGFERVVKKSQDDYWANPAYFRRRRLPMPYPSKVAVDMPRWLSSPAAAPSRNTSTVPATRAHTQSHKHHRPH